MSLATYFISDLHLEESRPEITQAFLRFIDEIKPEAEALYILGDFFESWIGDDENTPLQASIKQALSDLTQSGTSVYLMHGNRDFLIGHHFEEESGCNIIPDPSLIDLYNTPTLLMHGDSLCTEDKEYMKFRQNMRNETWQTLFLNRPLEDRQTTARQLREISQLKNKGKPIEIMDVTPDEVINVMNEYGVLHLIHGHTHRPDCHNVNLGEETGKRWVLGDWGHQFWYLKATPNTAPKLIKKDI
jgi:UDP-2,3-diacylglucosamine hydrolase